MPRFESSCARETFFSTFLLMKIGRGGRGPRIWRREGKERGKERGKEGKGEEEERFEELLKLSFFCFLHSTLRSIASRNK